MAASGNRRFLYQPHRTHYFLPALGFPQPRGIQGQLLGSLKEEFPQLQPHPIRAAPRAPPGTQQVHRCLAVLRSILKTPGESGPFSLA